MGEREGEKHQCVVASCVPPTGDLAYNPDMCLRLGVTSDPLVHRLALNPLNQSSHGYTLSTHFPISCWVIYECTCPHCAECSVVFDQKWCGPYAPPSLFTQSHPEQFFLFPLDEKSPQRETF